MYKLSLSRFRFLFTLAFCQAVFGGVNALVANDTRPNVVFIYADDLGFGDLACHGHPRIMTPNLDRIAKEGIDFWSFTVVNPVCSPSRTGIVTGQFPSRWGVHQHFAQHAENAARGMPDWLDTKAPLLPRVMKQAGYRTAHYGKWHLSGGGDDDAPLPPAYGYDDAKTWTGPGPHVFDGTNYRSDNPAAAPHDNTAASWLSVAATDHALKFIRESKNQPFYINLWLHETHHLVSATQDDKAIYLDVEEPHRTYYAAVSRADRQVGRVLGLLDELGIAKDTLIMFSSDNGPENSQTQPQQKFYYSQGSTGGLRGRKRSLLMGGVNVPFLVRWPAKIPAGRIDKQTALAGVDVFPTVLAATAFPRRKVMSQTAKTCWRLSKVDHNDEPSRSSGGGKVNIPATTGRPSRCATAIGASCWTKTKNELSCLTSLTTASKPRTLPNRIPIG